MPVEVQVPSMLRKYTGGQRLLRRNKSTTVRDLIDAIERDYPGLRDQLLEQGELRRFVNIFCNDEDIRFLAQLDTPLHDGDVIAILPALAGG